jgi:hypothetical protein
MFGAIGNSSFVGLPFNLVDKKGLVYSLIAGDKSSYPGFGTSWFDLTVNNRIASLLNGVAFNDGLLGSLTFDGVNDYATLGNFTIGQEVTMLFWINGNFQNRFLALFSRRLPNNISTSTGTGSNVPIPNNGWVQVGYQGNSLGLNRFIINGKSYIGNTGAQFGYDNRANIRTLFSMDVSPFSSIDKQITEFNIVNSAGVTGGYTWADRNTKLLAISATQLQVGYMNVDIQSVLIYNRVLSDKELELNYNRMRDFFNLYNP